MSKYEIEKTEEFQEWFLIQKSRSKAQIEKRLLKIKSEGHFGHINKVGDELFELKFTDGRRIYYTIIPISKVILLLGGNKNGQQKDITQAKKIRSEYT